MIERYFFSEAEQDAPDPEEMRDELIRACTSDPHWRLMMLTAINCGDEDDIDLVLEDYQADLLADVA